MLFIVSTLGTQLWITVISNQIILIVTSTNCVFNNKSLEAKNSTF